MECLRASMVCCVWCGSAGNNSKVVRCWNDRDVSVVSCDDDRFVCAVG